MLNRSIASLTPSTQEKAERFLQRCKDEGLAVSVTEARRSPETQAIYYLRGRVDVTDPNIVEAIQILGAAHAWRFTPKEIGTKVTWTMQSNHIAGTAIDIVLFDEQRNADWSGTSRRWQRALEIARECGFACGADWPAPKTDIPHLENL